MGKPKKTREPPCYLRVVDGRGKELQERDAPAAPHQQIAVIVIDRFKNRVLWGQTWDIEKLSTITDKALAEGGRDVEVARGLITIGNDARDAVYDAVTKALRRKLPRSKRK